MCFWGGGGEGGGEGWDSDGEEETTWSKIFNLSSGATALRELQQKVHKTC